MNIDTETFQALTFELEAQRAGHAKFDALAEEARRQLTVCGRILARPHTAAAAVARLLRGRLAGLATALEHAAAGAYAFEQAIAEGIRVGELRTGARHAHGGRHARPRHASAGHLRLVAGGGQ